MSGYELRWLETDAERAVVIYGRCTLCGHAQSQFSLWRDGELRMCGCGCMNADCDFAPLAGLPGRTA